MKSPHWMPLYIGDYLRDTMGLSAAEHGSYFLLIMAYWTNGGPLPDDPRYLAEIAKVQQCDWPGLSNRISKFFQINGGLWSHSRIEKELAEAVAHYERRSKAGKLGVEAKRKRISSNAESKVDHCDTQPQPQPHLSTRESAERPSFDEVAAYAQTISLAEWKARDWFDEMEGCGWIDFQHRPVVAWKPMLNRVRTKWEADGRPMHPPASRFSQPANDSTGKPKQEPLWVQVKATEKLIADCNARLRAIPHPAPTVFPEEAAAAEAKRKPLREQKAQLVERLTELNRLQAESGSSDEPQP